MSQCDLYLLNPPHPPGYLKAVLTMNLIEERCAANTGLDRSISNYYVQKSLAMLELIIKSKLIKSTYKNKSAVV